MTYAVRRWILTAVGGDDGVYVPLSDVWVTLELGRFAKFSVDSRTEWVVDTRRLAAA